MKKFLSLVLAVIMTMSLVTISASAAEYDDFTDKDEIKYEEAVAVLNRLGIITGYSEGDFRPEGELTRGAAAKIIVSLLIGPEAANNVSPTSAPYKDVPLDHTFAGVIAYCKTAGIISGYSDGSFQPGGTLTGYAFSKMLLGALGFKSDVEHFTGAGWNMNVNARAAEAGLFDRLSFKGNEPVNREQAAQLALNTLKATMVEYNGGFTVSAGDAQVVGAQTRTYKVSNQEYAKHISNRKASDQGNITGDTHYTVEFGEEHFVDLRMDNDRSARDDFGRVSNKWSYKKVTIGTFPVEPDFTYDNQVTHREDTAAAKKRATGLSGYEVNDKTQLWLNGFPSDTKLNGVEDIADYTDNGNVVEVYVSDTTADLITDVVVIQTQLMEVKRVGSDYVSLQMYDNGKSDNIPRQTGYNMESLNLAVQDVQEEDSTYKLLSGLKTGDIVAIVPVSIDRSNTQYDVAEAYVPETASGSLTSVDNYGSANTATNAVGLTVGGTAYKIANWNKDMIDLTAQKIKVTKKDVTLYLDKSGNAMLAKDIGATDDWMVIGNFRQTLENGRLVHIINGWDISGTEVSLNVGPNAPSNALKPGDLVHYNSTTSDIAEWSVVGTNAGGVFTIYAGTDTNSDNGQYMIRTSNDKIALKGYDNTTTPNNMPAGGTAKNDTEYMDKSVKFIYVHFNNDGEVESIEVKKTVQEVKNAELLTAYKSDSTYTALTAADEAYPDGYNRAQAAVKLKTNGESTVKAVVIKSESNDAIASNMLYVKNWNGGAGYDENGKMIHKYTVAMNSADGVSEQVIYSDKELNRGDFASYTLSENDTFSPFYKLSNQNDQIERTTSTFRATINDTKTDELRIKNKNLVALTDYKKMDGTTTQTPKIATSDKDPGGHNLGVGGNKDTVNLRNAEWVDLVTKNDSINSVDELAKYKNVKVALIVNDNEKNNGFRQVSMIVVLEADPKTDDAVTPAVTVTANNANPARGDAVTLTAAISNSSSCGTLSYQWLEGSTEIAGATSSTYSFNADKIGATTYTVRVTNTDSSKENQKTAVGTGDVTVTVASNESEVTVNFNGNSTGYATVLNGDGTPITNGNKFAGVVNKTSTLVVEAANSNDVVTATATGADVSVVGKRVLVTPTAAAATVTITVDVYVAPENLKVAANAISGYTTAGVNENVVPGTTKTVHFVATAAGAKGATPTLGVVTTAATGTGTVTLKNFVDGKNAQFETRTLTAGADAAAVTAMKAFVGNLYTANTATAESGAALTAVTNADIDAAAIGGATYYSIKVVDGVEQWASKAAFDVDVKMDTAAWNISGIAIS